MILIINLTLCAATHKRIGTLDIATHSQQCHGGMVPHRGPPTIAPAVVPMATGPDRQTGYLLPVRRALISFAGIPSHRFHASVCYPRAPHCP
jgi:hypothetical protein